jgi:hypothetical protein
VDIRQITALLEWCLQLSLPSSKNTSALPWVVSTCYNNSTIQQFNNSNRPSTHQPINPSTYTRDGKGQSFTSTRLNSSALHTFKATFTTCAQRLCLNLSRRNDLAALSTSRPQKLRFRNLKPREQNIPITLCLLIRL